MKFVIDISRIVIGFVFIFSGFVKAVDPSGTAIKLEEYFLAFGMDFMAPTAMPLAVLLSAAEMLIGLNFLTKTLLIFTSWLLLIFMGYFTGLTFILALTNPVTDCGCFGDAIKLTNWQTFWKNIVLILPTLILFFNRKRINQPTSLLKQWLLAVFNFFVPLIISLYCLFHEPIMDFRPYTIGTHIVDKMHIPDGAPMDMYESVLIYEKDGVKKEFNSSNFPWQDSTWKWVETKQILISKGYEPPIHDFLITSPDDVDITENLLNDSNYIFLIIAPKLENASKKGMEKLNNLAIKMNNLGYSVFCLTSSTNDEIEKFKNTALPVFEVCMADETTLKTIQRSNPGLLILKGGTIIGKYNYRDAPEENEIKSDILSVVLEKQHSQKEKLVVFSIFFALLYLYSLILLPVQFKK